MNVPPAIGRSPYAEIGLFVQHATVKVLLKLADRLIADHGARIHLFVRGEAERAHYAALGEGRRWASVQDYDVPNRALTEPLGDERAIEQRARALEERLGITFGELLLAHRHLGRGFSPLGAGLPLAPRFAGLPAARVLHYYCVTLDFWLAQFRDKTLSLMLQGNKEAMVVARALGVPNRRLSVTRYKDFWYWSEDEYQRSPAIEAAYRGIVSAPPPDIERPYGANLHKRKSVDRRRRLWPTAVATGINLAHWGNWLLRRRHTPPNLTLSTALFYPWQRWAAFRGARRMLTARLADLDGRPFVYVPLQKEPEAAFQLRSPEYFFQHAMILSLARDVPAGVRIAVKENLAAIGQRPAGFYRQLARLPNVVLLDPDEPGIACARKSDATCVIVGTAGLEAALLGKPVITYGRHGNYNFLPHVMTVTDEAQLKPYLGRIFRSAVDLDRARADGARMLAALVAVSFDAGNALTGGSDEAEGDRVAALAAAALDQTFGRHAPRQDRAAE